jgi:anti-sigma B factor antagonist
MNIELRTHLRCGHAVAALIGELDTTDAVTTAAAVEAIAAGGQWLIIDLEGLDYIDCHALCALLGVRQAVRQMGGDVLLAAPHGSVLRLLTLIGVPGVHASIADAENACGRPCRRAMGAAPSVYRAPDDGSEARRLVLPGGRG